MSDQILQKVSGDIDPIKKIAMRIPGFDGFIKRSEYRDADKLLRETIARDAEKQNQRISELQRDFISQGQIEFVDDLEASNVKLRTFTDRVRFATRGYAGVFDAVKINEPELAVVYQYDAAMLDQLDEVTRAVDNVESSIGSEGLPAAIRNLRTVSQALIDTFDQREDVMKGIAKK
ncbi:MAG: uncharacterized protein H6Q37_1371 [Chloroflexi bacterium]|jgi:hypothetical protein|nr:uncharacterized protein [Chloroflexota bacterium]